MVMTMLPVSIAPGMSQDVQVILTPQGSGAVTGKVVPQHDLTVEGLPEFRRSIGLDA